METSKTLPGLKVSSVNYVVYEDVDALILFLIFASVLEAR